MIQITRIDSSENQYLILEFISNGISICSRIDAYEIFTPQEIVEQCYADVKQFIDDSVKDADHELPIVDGTEIGTELQRLIDTKLKFNRVNAIINRMRSIREELSATDYKAIKFAEGCYTDAEYAPTKLMRDNLRAEYNALEVELANAPEYLPE